MLNKKLVLGSLAGATLLAGAAFMLPSAAQAAVQGTCVNCHTMHNSQTGAVVIAGTTYGDAANGMLLNQDCVGCHTGAANNTLGVDTAAPNAPQVGATASASANAAGYFNVAVGTSHTVAASITTMAADLATAPGGAFATAAGFDCEDCHGATGAHHGTPASYRMLDADAGNDGTADGITVTPGGTVDTQFGNLDASASTYDGLTMNAFCAACHGTFHGNANTNTASPFVRHPTTNGTTAIDAALYGASHTGSAVVPVGEGAVSDVMCISCHRAHGSGELDMLRFNYAANNAGDTTTDLGCETCHGQK